MKEKLPLNELYKKCITGVLNRKEFEGRIFQYILDNYRYFRLYNWNREQCSDFLSWLYPRLSRAIDVYQERGATFDAYIGSIVYWSAREYRSRQTAHHITEYACWEARAEEMTVQNPEPDYLCLKPPQKVPNPRQILMLLLKSYFFVSDEFLAWIAPAVRMEPEKLRRIVEELRNRRLQREDEILGLRERIHSQYYRCISFEKKLLAAPEGSAIYEKMSSRLIRAKRRLAAMKKRLAGIRFNASNRQIAEVLGIPKGTVDSNLFALKAKFQPMLPGREAAGSGGAQGVKT